MPAFVIVGLPDTAVQEARERVKSAIKNSGFLFPRGKVIINLAPADLKKIGPRYDLAIALGILAKMEIVSSDRFHDIIMIGELALNGEVRPTTGIVATVECARKSGFKKIILPQHNAEEAMLISGIQIIPIKHLKEAVQYMKGKWDPVLPKKKKRIKTMPLSVDMAVIRGQAQAKRALEIAAAGGHNVLFNGAPGAGKTLLARAFAGILPSMSKEEMLAVTKIYSIANLLPKSQPLITQRPFRTIHHTASAVSIVGGGNIPGPGEISLAHRGVLFMDEIAEFPNQVLEVLRQPMEDQMITVSRVRGTVTYPAQFILIAAMNPCPCGYLNVENSYKACNCTAYQVERYRKRLSGPLLDRIDIHLNIHPVDYKKLTNTQTMESSGDIRKRVEQASQHQRNRFKKAKITYNAEMQNAHIEKDCPLTQESKDLLGQAMQKMNLSARGYYRIIKVARTIADLSNEEKIKTAHIAEALQYRSQSWN